MKLNAEDSEIVQSSVQHMSPPSLARPKSSMGTLAVDMGSRGDADIYSPNKKFSRPEPVSRIHCIPVLMVLVFFILWLFSSSEIKPEVHTSGMATTEVFVTKMPTPNKFATAGELKDFNNMISLHSTRTVLNDDLASNTNHATRLNEKLSEKTYLRGNTRQDGT